MNTFEFDNNAQADFNVADVIGKSLVGEVAGSHPEVVDALADSLTLRGIGQYLTAANRNLDGRTPYEALQTGDVAAVQAAAQSFVSGDYL